jgi:hypothetical protein
LIERRLGLPAWPLLPPRQRQPVPDIMRFDLTASAETESRIRA